MLTGDVVAARVVTTGRATRTGVEILKGLAAGEQVVTGPPDVLRALTAGKRVRAEAGQP